MSKIITAEEAAKLIKDNDFVATTGTSGLAGLPEELIASIGERYEKEQSPKNITFMNGSGIGINTEGRGMDYLAQEGLIKRVISGHAGFSHRMSRLIVENKIEGYFFPQGVITQLWRSIAGKKPGVITKVGLNTLMDPRVQGGKINSVTKEDLISVVELNGEEWLLYENLPVNVAIIRGTTADENGNITTEREVANFEILSLATAVRNNGGIVIAQVERIAEAGSLNPKEVRVPGVMVDYVVQSQNPEYHYQTMSTAYNPALSAELKVPLNSIKPAKLDAKKVISRRAAMELTPKSIVNLGVGMPSLVSSVATEEGVQDEMTLTVEFGLFGGSPAPAMDFGASYNADAIINHDHMFDFYDGGGLDVTFLGLAQLDQQGNVNVSKFGSRLMGPGGFINISQSSKKVVFMGTFAVGSKEKFENGQIIIENHGKGKKIIEQVEQITFSGEYASKADIPVLYITERAVFDVVDGKLRLIEIAPGLDLEKDIIAWMEFRPLIAEDLKTMDSALFQEQWGQLKDIIEEKKNFTACLYLK